MYDYLIRDYIKKIKIEDVFGYAKKNNIAISEKDANILLYYAKNHYQELISDNSQEILNEIKEKINSNTYKEAYKLYLKYKLLYQKNKSL